MKSRDFCFWLQGFFEVANPGMLTVQQVGLIKQHLGLVFKHDIGADGSCDHPPLEIGVGPVTFVPHVSPLKNPVVTPPTAIGIGTNPETIFIC